MKKTGFLIVVFILTLSSFYLKSQELIYNRSVTGICYAGDKVNRIYIPPPKGFGLKSGSKGGGIITVIYTGFSTEAKSAVDYAVNILESVLPSDLKMTIKASWTKISTASVLGNSSITGFAGGWGIDAFEPMAFYPVTVAEKIAGKGLNEDYEADVELVLNSTAKWYLGTDGNTPVSKYDLVTVVLHELCHGLGFFDSMDAENSVGSYGIGKIPVIYDEFIENLIEKKLTDTTVFRQNSKDLYDELVGGQLYFAGPLTRKYLSGSRARLYAPSTWDPGSSVSHLDELRTNQADALMTPYIDYGEAIHNPGNLTLSMLGDMGWINTRIIPRKIKDTEEPLTEIELNAVIHSDTAYNKNMVGLVYSFDGFLTSDTLVMSPVSFKDSYYGKIQIPSYNTKIDYYFYTADVFSRLFRSPSLAEKDPYSVYVGTDTVKPVISHSPAEYFFEKIDSIHLNANVTDNLGVDTVFIEYRVNSGVSEFYGLRSGDSDEYSASLPLKSELLKGGDSLEYRIVAIDKASGRNMSMSPSSGYYSVRIEALLPIVTNYSTDFSDAAPDFFNSGFEIAQPTGFSSPGLHSEHPYESPDEDYKSLELSSVLRHPVIFDASGMIISFKELVLVEPGAEGSIFGFSDFYDYVILEASKDFGKAWFSLADGYDSRIIKSWETAYNSLIDGQNSTFEGKESMMLEHVFYPRISDRISGGDSLLIRFRLYSDPYAHGWGWAIDDLRINPLVDQVEEVSTPNIIVFPNPGNGLVNIIFDGTKDLKPVRINIYDYTGRCIIHEKAFNEERATLDISGNPSGLYLIVINNGQNTRTIKYNLVK
jgi:hypothetical protein